MALFPFLPPHRHHLLLSYLRLHPPALGGGGLGAGITRLSPGGVRRGAGRDGGGGAETRGQGCGQGPPLFPQKNAVTVRRRELEEHNMENVSITPPASPPNPPQHKNTRRSSHSCLPPPSYSPHPHPHPPLGPLLRCHERRPAASSRLDN